MKKILALSASVLILLGAMASPVSADWRGGYYGGWYGYRGWVLGSTRLPSSMRRRRCITHLRLTTRIDESDNRPEISRRPA